MIRTCAVVEFTELFNHAEKFDADWNESNAIFFDEGALKYKGYDEFEEIHMLENYNKEWDSYEDIDYDVLTNIEKGYYIIQHFMREHRLFDLIVLNN